MNSQDFHNWCKLQFLLATKASEFLRNLLKKLWQTRFNKQWDNSSGQELVNLIKPKMFKVYFKSQQSLLKNGDIDNWDLQLLRNVFVDSDIGGSGKQGDDNRKNTEKLAEFRNKLEHHPSKSVSDADFEVNWEKISKTLVKMGESKDELDELKVSLRSNKMLILRSQNITKANEIRLKGNEYFKEEKYTEAISSYTDAINLKEIPDQDLAILYSNRSASYLNRYSETRKNDNDIKNALKDAKKSKELDSEWFKAELILGKVYREKNKLDKSIKAFERALFLEPSSQEIRDALAEAKDAKHVQECYLHLDPGAGGVTPEQMAQDFFARTGNNLKPELIEKQRKFLEEEDPVLKEVWKGHDYRDGNDGLKQDYAMAAKYYQAAAEKGNAEAMYNLAGLISTGRGMKKDFTFALSLLRQAAEQPPFDKFGYPTVGVAEAEHGIGVAYLYGIDVDKDISQAIYWFQRATEHGSGRSANNLGIILSGDDERNHDLKRAEQFYLLAASRGDHHAPDNLVDLYLRLEKPEKAIAWNQKGIEKGSARAISREKDLELFHLMCLDIG